MHYVSLGCVSTYIVNYSFPCLYIRKEQFFLFFIVVFVVKEVKIFHGETLSCVAKVTSLSMGDRSWIVCASHLQMPVLVFFKLGYCNKM